MTRKLHESALTALFALAVLMVAGPAFAMGDWPGGETDNCANQDGALNDAAFVFTTSPSVGDRVTSGFEVKGCSRTFESTVNWKLVGRNGSELASGHTQGGGVDGAGPFSFTVNYSVPAQEIGHLEVFEEDASDGEGNPPGRNVLSLVLK
jgi:Immunoglobulin-like domain of bacterial spore germination